MMCRGTHKLPLTMKSLILGGRFGAFSVMGHMNLFLTQMTKFTNFGILI